MKINFYTLFFLISILCLQFSCKPETEPKTLKDGVWRAELEREDGNNVVFNFEVKDSAGQKAINIFNAEESLHVDSIAVKNDSVFIEMPFFGSNFRAKIQANNELKGKWTIDYGSRLESMPFEAVYGDSTRFKTEGKAQRDINGTWETTFVDEEGEEMDAIGLFKQQGNQVTGTFLTAVGDYRYLQGVVSGDTLKMSGFDGCHALLFSANIDGEDQLESGKLYAVNRPAQEWRAEKKDYDSLPNAYAAKNIPQGQVKADFNLQDMRTGEDVSIEDEAYQDKVVVLQILGSWCPNCLDETKFMTDYYDKNRDKDIEFIAIDFERTADFDKSKKALSSFFKRFDINYPVLFSGVASADPKLSEKIFPGLPTKIQAFPSTIFVDKEGFIRKVHSGFNGPATGEYYDEFKEDFKGIVNGLLAE